MSFRDLIMLNARDYLLSAGDVYINLIMLFIALALSVASFWINHHKTYMVEMIKQLLRRNAIGEENAKTLAELHLADSKSLKAALNRRGQLTEIVKRAGYVEPTYEEYVDMIREKKHKEEKIDFAVSRFYIPEQSVEKATLIKEKENPTILRTALVCVLIFSLCVCLMLLMPGILNLLSNLQESESL